MNALEKENQSVNEPSDSYLNGIRKWKANHESELNELKELDYEGIYSKAVSLFKNYRKGDTLLNTATKALGLKDTKSVYVAGYIDYLHGHTIVQCVENIKYDVRQELFHKVNVPLLDIYSKEELSLFEAYDNIPFTGVKFSICKMFIDGWTAWDIYTHLNLTAYVYSKLMNEILQYAIVNDCGATKKLRDIITARFEYKFQQQARWDALKLQFEKNNNIS